MHNLKIKFCNENAKNVYENGTLLRYQTTGSSGFDLKAVDIFLPKTKETLVLGKDIENYEYEVQVRPRSGLAFKHGITIVNTPGTIDSDYRGEIGAILCNLSNDPFLITKGERIAQMVVCPIVKCNINIVDELDETERGAGRLGSTGMKN